MIPNQFITTCRTARCFYKGGNLFGFAMDFTVQTRGNVKFRCLVNGDFSLEISQKLYTWVLSMGSTSFIFDSMKVSDPAKSWSQLYSIEQEYVNESIYDIMRFHFSKGVLQKEIETWHSTQQENARVKMKEVMDSLSANATEFSEMLRKVEALLNDS